MKQLHIVCLTVALCAPLAMPGPVQADDGYSILAFTPFASVTASAFQANNCALTTTVSQLNGYDAAIIPLPPEDRGRWLNVTWKGTDAPAAGGGLAGAVYPADCPKGQAISQAASRSVGDPDVPNTWKIFVPNRGAWLVLTSEFHHHVTAWVTPVVTSGSP
jgi:hypothetical protein